MPSDDLVKYFIQHTDKKFDDLEKKTVARFVVVEKKIDSLLQLRWTLFGAALGISAVISFLFQVGMAIAGKL